MKYRKRKLDPPKFLFLQMTLPARALSIGVRELGLGGSGRGQWERAVGEGSGGGEGDIFPVYSGPKLNSPYFLPTLSVSGTWFSTN